MRSSTTTSHSLKSACLLRRPPLHDVRARVGEEQHLVAEALLRIDDDRQRVVLDDDELGGVGGLVAVFGDDGDHGLADVAHGADRDEGTAHRLGEARIDVRCEPELGEVVADEHGDHARSRLRVVDVDRDDPSVRFGRADVGEPRGVLEREVIDVRAADGQHPCVFDPLHAVAEDARAQRCPSAVFRG